jgi:hypothetical protein
LQERLFANPKTTLMEAVQAMIGFMADAQRIWELYGKN